MLVLERRKFIVIATITVIVLFVLAALLRGEQPALRPIGPLAQRGMIEITWVQPNSPASRAGLEAGDRVVEVNGFTVQTLEAFRNALQSAGYSARLTVINRRTGDYTTVHVYPIDGRIGVDARVVYTPWPPF